MRRHRRLLGALFALMAAFAVVCATTGQAHAYDYGYTVRVFQGNGGKLSNDPVRVEVAKNEKVDLMAIAKADTSNSKYVQIGFRLSGRDALYSNGVSHVTEDMDFVVAYGFEGELVEYTLRFVEYGTGRELASPQTYYGRVGDKPVAAYEYIEGYRPLYYSITGTLKENPEDNIWTFEYVALQEGETTETETTSTSTTETTTPGNETVNTETTYVPGDTTTTTRTETVPGTSTTQPGTTTDGGTTNGGTTVNPGANGGTTTTTVAIPGTNTTGPTTFQEGATTVEPSTTTPAANAGGGGGGTPGNVAADAGTSTAAGINEGTGGQEAAPATREILDMDNPLAGPGGSNTGSGGNADQAGSRINTLIPIAIALAIALALALFFFWKRKKDSENEPETETEE